MRLLPAVLSIVVITALSAACRSNAPATSSNATPAEPFKLVEAPIAALRQALDERRTTSREIVQGYLTRIALYEDRFNATIAVNPNALSEADTRDRERAGGKLRGPLHGIPIALKDNIHTTDLPTTGGAVAFEGLLPPYEATLTKNLRDAGAIILAKTTLTELANWVAGAPTAMPGNYNGLTGYALNPYDPRRDPRQATADGRPALGTGGSSSGAGTALNFWAANVGTETSGSILSPANQNMLAAIKPTVGRVSRYGVIPITADQDTAGPMTKFVADAALLLGVLESAAPDANDPATSRCEAPANRDYTVHLKTDGLKGARIGIPRSFFYTQVTPPGTSEPRGGLSPEQNKMMTAVIEVLKQQGATIVDPAEIPSVIDPDAKKNFLTWSTCSGADNARGKDDGCSIVFKYGMKRDFNAWLNTLQGSSPLKTLTALRDYNKVNTSRGAIKYGQSQLDISDEMDLGRDRARYESDRARDLAVSAAHGIDEVMKAQTLDALLFPGASGAAIAAKPGYPTVIVPYSTVPNAPTPSFPGGFDARPAPYGVSFTGMACSEPRLIEMAYAFEQATRRRMPPPAAP